VSEAAVRVTVVLARPEGAEIRPLSLAPGATVADAVRASGLLERIPAAPVASTGSRFGIFGRRVEPDRVLASGDQVEIYLPLQSDPKSRRLAVARRQRNRVRTR
jgi:putative ubiquitin-RnfH superfamily antitoxin RatB of RatAB toxin-antitoxin module